MQRPEVATKEVTLPSGIVANLKTTFTYGDDKAVREAVLGEMTVGSEKVQVSYAQAEKMVSTKILRGMIAWNVTEPDGSPTPITAENIDDILTDQDVTFIVKELGEPKKK